MGVFAQSSLMRERARGSRRGIALPSLLFAMLVVGILGATVFVITDLHGRTVANRERSMRAMHLAESGVSHAIAIVRTVIPDTALSRLLLGPDKAPNTADDGQLNGWAMPVGAGIPGAGFVTTGGRYFVTVRDDVVDPTPDIFDDGNSRVSAICRGVTNDGATATAEVLLGVAQFPAFGVDGPLTISGNPTIRGECGDAHANADITVSGTVKIQGDVTTSDDVDNPGNVQTLTGGPNPPLQNQPPLEVPDLNASDYCGDAQFILKANGTIIKKGTPDQVFNATSSGVFGWKRSSSSPVVWETDGLPISPGTICVEGNLKISSNPGSPASPLALSILATGSVEISGNPTLTSAHPQGIGIISNGDVKINGNPTTTVNNYNGLIFAAGQCDVSGNPNIGGQILCKNKSPQPSGVWNLTSDNTISGDAKIRYECGGFLAGQRRVLYWFQQLNK